MTVTAPRVTPMALARSAREIGCWARTRLSAILRLMSRDVPCLATLNRLGSIRRIKS